MIEGEEKEGERILSFDDLAQKILEENPTKKDGNPHVLGIEEAEKRYGPLVWELYGRSDYAYLSASRLEDKEAKEAAQKRDEELRDKIGLHYEKGRFDQFDFYRWINNLAQRLDAVNDSRILEKIKLRLRGFGLEALDSGDIAVAVCALHEAGSLDDENIIRRIKKELDKLKQSEEDGDKEKFDLAVREIGCVYSGRVEDRNS